MTHPTPLDRFAERWTLKLLFALPLAASLSALSACADDPVEPGEQEIGTVRLTLGAQTIDVTPRGTTVSVTVSGATTAVSAAFLDEDGAPLALDGDEFELRLVPTTSGRVTYAATTPFSGTLTRVSTGTVTVNLEIFHRIEGHSDFEAVLNVTVQ